jgi:hypothetical protein
MPVSLNKGVKYPEQCPEKPKNGNNLWQTFQSLILGYYVSLDKYLWLSLLYNEMLFDNVRVPKKAVVGEMNKGWYYLRVALDFERLVIPIGGSRRTFEEIVRYARETKHNGQALSQQPLIRNKLANIAIQIEIAYVLFWHVAWMLDRGLVPNIEASVLKLFTTELNQKLVSCLVNTFNLLKAFIIAEKLVFAFYQSLD